jgi:cyclopropane-fatty-acyl-phospholipid synthase
MPGRSSRRIVEEILALAEIRIGGENPWDPEIKDERFFDRVLTQGTLGLGESYMDGWWDVASIDQFIERALRSGIKDQIAKSWKIRLAMAGLRLLDRQSLRGSRKVARTHYDLGNEFFARMLGPTMTYSCGYWPAASSLDEAQRNKHDLICRKLGLGGDHHVLDIGCGWGSFLAHAHQRTGCRGMGVTISEPQWNYAREAHGGKPIRYCFVDYRDRSIDAAAPFDRIVSVGMFEHVGLRHYREFFTRVRALLKDDGLFLLHTMGNRLRSGVDPWNDKYIVPNSVVPCVSDVARYVSELFVLEDWHAFGDDYDRTLMAWAQNFEDYAREPGFPFDRTFCRMWRYYLHSFAGAFRARNYLQLWQIVVSKRGTRGGYRSVR